MPRVGSEGNKVGDAPYRPDGRRRRKFVLVSNLLNIPERFPSPFLCLFASDLLGVPGRPQQARATVEEPTFGEGVSKCQGPRLPPGAGQLAKDSRGPGLCQKFSAAREDRGLSPWGTLLLAKNPTPRVDYEAESLRGRWAEQWASSPSCDQFPLSF